MCVDLYKQRHITEEPFFVWKVLITYNEEWYPAFYYPDGKGCSYWKGVPKKPFSLEEYAQPLTGGDIKTGQRLGYCCFETRELAEKFIEECQGPRGGFGDALSPILQAKYLVPVKFTVPKGAAYYKGKIRWNCLGCGMDAMVVERLVEPWIDVRGDIEQCA